MTQRVQPFIMKHKVVIQTVCLATMALLLIGKAHAQQLEPRAYSPAPAGTNFFGLGFLYSSGDALLDPTLPIQNVSARIYNTVPYFGRTFDFFGRLANFTLTTPYAWGTVTGDVQETSMSVDRSGFADPLMRIAVNLIGLPALRPLEFLRHKPETTLGASLTVTAPLGQYDSTKLINLGTNRWAFKPEVGLSQPLGNWTLEFYAGVWLFTANDNFFGAHVRRQDPLLSLQAHVVYEFHPRLWAAFDYTYYEGGSTTVDGQHKDDRQDNSRAGVTLAMPVSLHQSLKLTWTRGVTTRIGSSFDTVGAAWQWVWF
jgi:hypothetical protein